MFYRYEIEDFHGEKVIGMPFKNNFNRESK